MNHSKFTAVLAALLIATGAFVAWQYRVVQRLQAENDNLKEISAEAEHLRDENRRLTMSPTDAKELEQLRKDQSELLRLRDELARLRQRLKEVSAKAPPPKQIPAAPTPDPTQPASPVDTFQATVRAVMTPDQALVTGGWTTGEGKRTFVVIQPEILVRSGLDSQVSIQTRFVELPDEAVSEAGFEALKADDKRSSTQAILSEEQTRAAVAFFEATKGVNMLSSPKVSTLAGRQAQIKSVSLKTIDGESYEMGPCVDVVPYLSTDQATLEMTVIATLRQLAGPAR